MCVIFCRRRRNNGKSWPRSVQHWWWQPQVTGGRRCIWGRGRLEWISVVDFGKSLRPHWIWWRTFKGRAELCADLSKILSSMMFYLYVFFFLLYMQILFVCAFAACVSEYGSNHPIVLWFAYENMRRFPKVFTLPSLSPFLRSKWPSYFLCIPQWTEREQNWTGISEKKMCWHSNYLRVLKAFQDINVFIKIEHDQLKSFDSVFTDWQMFGWSDEVKSSSRVVFRPGGHLVLNRCWDVFWYSYTYW